MEKRKSSFMVSIVQYKNHVPTYIVMTYLYDLTIERNFFINLKIVINYKTAPFLL